MKYTGHLHDSQGLSLQVHSLYTASPMQCLLVAVGDYGCRKAPELNCKVEISMTQLQNRRKRKKSPKGCESR